MGGLSGDETVRILYLVLLGCAVVFWLTGLYRGRLGTALRDLAIWVLIFAFALIAYDMRDVIGRGLDPTMATSVGEGGTVRLTRGAGGHFRVAMEIEGTRVVALVDTGATDLVLTQEDARRIGLDPDRLAYTQRAMTANGVVSGAPVRLSRVAVGPAVFENVPAVVNGGALATSLLGMGLLDRFSGFEVRGDTMLLHR